MNLEDLPVYIYSDRNRRLFLSVNRDIQGKWCIAYVDYETNDVMFPMNDFNSLEAAALTISVRLNDAGR